MINHDLPRGHSSPVQNTDDHFTTIHMLDITDPMIFVDTNTAIRQLIERGQDLNLRPSGYEPNIFAGFLPYIEMVDTWWTALMNLILGGQMVDS